MRPQSRERTRPLHRLGFDAVAGHAALVERDAAEARIADALRRSEVDVIVTAHH